jgi:signal transduction histidine kinase/CheY-like chemotaxis protein
LPRPVWPYLETGLGHYLLLMGGIAPFLALMLGLLYQHELHTLGAMAPDLQPTLGPAFLKAYAAFLLVSGIVAWWLVLTQQSRRVAQEESNRQTRLLMAEIQSHRLTDEALQKARLLAEQANQAKSRYITAVSHELRTPLNSILGYAQILDGDPSIPGHRRRAVEVIRRSGDHLLSLIEGTLDIARIEGGRLTLEVKALDFQEFLQHIVRMFEVQAREKGVTFHFEELSELPAAVRGDEKRLRQILLNILGNAVKFTAHGSVSFRVRYAREMASFEIQDTGPGIGPEDQARIFEPFVRGAAAAGGAGGAGLGLTISRMLTGLMGGEMSLESAPGQGSLFRVRLYLPAVDADRAPRAVTRLNRAGYRGEKRRILVVDNEAVDRELLANILEPLGFDVAQAASGEQCLALAPAIRPQLIFMDLAMPGLDGWETIRRLREDQHCPARIAVVSANAFEKGLRSSGEDGGVPPEDFILKPVRVEELLDWIGQALDLEWLEGPATPAPQKLSGPMPALVYPASRYLEALARHVELGYVRGIRGALDEIEAAAPECAEFVRLMRKLAEGYQFDAMSTHISKASPHDSPH